MEKLKERIHDEKNGLDYVLVGDYYYPDLKSHDGEIGRWGRAHENYLKAKKPKMYAELIHSGNFVHYLKDFNENAQSRFDLLIQIMKERENVTEALKAQDEMAWVGHMNSIRSRAEEVVMAELVCA